MPQNHKTIVVTNRKGGVGKTTVATHLAAALAVDGFRVGMVDTDAQGHVSLSFGLPKHDGLYYMMCDDEATFAKNLQVVQPYRYLPAGFPVAEFEPNLFILPGAKATSLIPIKQSSPFRLRRVIRDFAELLELDYIIVDTSPTANMFDGSVSIAADYFLYISECAALSFDGLVEAMSDLDDLNEDSLDANIEPAQILGIVPNKLRSNTRNHRENIAALGQQFPGKIFPFIRELTAFEVALDNGQVVWSQFDQPLDNAAAIADINAIIDRIFMTLGIGVPVHG